MLYEVITLRSAAKNHRDVTVVVDPADYHSVLAEMRAFVDRNPIVPGRHSVAARAALERSTIHIHDALADPEHSYAHGVDPFRTLLGIPRLRAGELLGVIVIRITSYNVCYTKLLRPAPPLARG